jgi:hypothetical protein
MVVRHVQDCPAGDGEQFGPQKHGPRPEDLELPRQERVGLDAGSKRRQANVGEDPVERLNAHKRQPQEFGPRQAPRRHDEFSPGGHVPIQRQTGRHL